MTHQTDRNAQAALVRAAASFVRDTYSGEWADDAAATLETDADLIERGEPCSLLRLAETMQPAAVSAAVAPPADEIRAQLLHAIDPAYTTGVLGYTTPEDLLAAYDNSRTPATDQAAGLRATLREVLDTFSPMKDTHNGPVAYYDGSAEIEPEQYDRWRAVLDGAKAVLPAPTDRAATLLEADWIVEHCPDHGCVEPSTDVCHCEIADRLRRLADETATETPAPSLRDQHRAAWRALTPDEQTARIAELDEPAAGAQQDETATETPDVYLTTPCDACDHTLNWHSSGETGCTVPRCACARYYHAAGARQDGAET
ncbi:hypothetical protein [Streptomyces sp. TRM75561]|uniref:hypothetical protein n=1 Tax=Streptomyces sp. TRM75561 TaxID=2975269 RepID=UPI00244CA853|nr:hypothetical protein [Streptomyces sp. TRM75561]MDH3037884.1 hypothetical protein [Streptomyces sp. TRM75561]